MKASGKILLVIQFVALSFACAQQGNKIPLANGGIVPVWLTNGPFEVETTGFGDLSDKSTLDEVNLMPEYNSSEINPSLPGGHSRWNYLSADEKGYTDIKEFYGWKSLGGAEKIWYEKIVYASAVIYSDKEQKAVIKSGGNTVIKITLNGEKVYSSFTTVNAKKDDFTDTVTLRKGENRLLIKVANSHKNHTVAFFSPINYEWGFYLRLTGVSGKALNGVSVLVNSKEVKSAFNIIPTFFYRKIEGIVKQKYLAEINSGLRESNDAELSFTLNGKKEKIHLSDIKFGVNEREFYVIEPKQSVQLNVKMQLGDDSADDIFTFKALPKYELYFMPTTHMDIGYTNPQPVVVERQLKTLDEVVEKCRMDKNFRWTIETMWLLENYRQSRSSEKFQTLINLIKKGQVAVSPVYTNPFTGWISENEMLESFRLAQEYKEKYGISYFGAIYNDVPGESWMLPEALRKAGVKVLIDGINEIFSNYKYQKSLPKVFNWLGSSQDTVTLYLTEAYTEGTRYGLEQDAGVIENRIWHTINNLRERRYPFNKVLINGALSDNSGIALKQYENALQWNKVYEYPKFVVSTLNEFSRRLEKENLDSLKTIRGDWTSDWDILNQGETKRMLKYRWVQNQLPSAEVLSSVSLLENPGSRSFASEINSVYRSMLSFSGHGSGLEYGFGSREENILTDRYREDYVESAFLKTQELLERSAYRITSPKESFDSHGVIVFNTLSWQRTMPVEVEFPETDLNNYSVVDLSNNTSVNSFRKGNSLYFLASDVPGIGYKQYELVNKPKKTYSPNKNSEAAENEFYSVSIENNALVIKDKTSGRNVFTSSNDVLTFMPARKVFQSDSVFKTLPCNIKLESVEKNNVYEELKALYESEVFREIKFRLYKNLNRIDIAVSLNLNGLKEPQNAEEYGLPLLTNVPENKVSFETLGGLTSSKDRFPAVGHQSYAIRRMIYAAAQDGTHYLISSPDCRIFTLDTMGGRNTLFANVLNNFPKSWNRNEDKDGMVQFRFIIAKADSSSGDVTRFGYEASTEPIVRKSWYRKDVPVKQFIKLSNPVVKLISLRPVDGSTETYELAFKNSSPDKKQSITVSSDELFSSSKVTEVNFLGEKTLDIPVINNSIKFELSPNSINKITVLKLHY